MKTLDDKRILRILIIIIALSTSVLSSRQSISVEPLDDMKKFLETAMKAQRNARGRAIAVTATGLYIAYSKNEIAADQKYRGEWLIVSGKVKRIGRNVLGTACVELAIKASYDCVECLFPPWELWKLSKLKTSQNVQILGTCLGLSYGDIVLDICELNPDTSPSQYLEVISDRSFYDVTGQLRITAQFRNTWIYSLGPITIEARLYDVASNLISRGTVLLSPAVLRPGQTGVANFNVTHANIAKRMNRYDLLLQKLERPTRHQASKKSATTSPPSPPQRKR